MDRLKKLLDTEQGLVISIVYSTTQKIDIMTQKLAAKTDELSLAGDRTEGKIDDTGSIIQGSSFHLIICFHDSNQSYFWSIEAYHRVLDGRTHLTMFTYLQL